MLAKAAATRTPLLARATRPANLTPAVAGGAQQLTHLAGDLHLQIRGARSTARTALRPSENSPRGLNGSQVPHPFSRCGSSVGRRWHAASCGCCAGSPQGVSVLSQISKTSRSKAASIDSTTYAPVSAAGSLPMTKELWNELSGEAEMDYNPFL